MAGGLVGEVVGGLGFFPGSTNSLLNAQLWRRIAHLMIFNLLMCVISKINKKKLKCERRRPSSTPTTTWESDNKNAAH